MCIDFPLIIAFGPFFPFSEFLEQPWFWNAGRGNCLCALKLIRVDLIPENPGKSVEIAEL